MTGRVRLTPRQRAILDLVGDGWGDREIAHHLGLSVRTVEHHREAARAALGARSTPHAVRLLERDLTRRRNV